MKNMILYVFYLLALWPSWKFLIERTLDQSDDPWGLFAACAILVLFFSKVKMDPKARVRQSQLDWAQFGLALLVLILYAITLNHIPDLAAALLGLSGLGLLSCQILYSKPFHQGCFLLHLLCAPLLPSVCFFTGYPVRLLISQIAAKLLQVQGLAVEAKGTALIYSNQTIFVDAPCSGIKLLWLGLIIASFFSALLSLNSRRTFLLIICTSLVTFILNVLRVNMLFFSEARIIPLDLVLQERIHTLVGLASVVLLMLCILVLTIWANRRTCVTIGDNCEDRQLSRHPLAPYLICALIAVSPLINTNKIKTVSKNLEYSIPESYEYQNTTYARKELNQREIRFSKDFPGSIRRYQSSDSELLIRVINKPSRKLHPSSDCLKGAGFSIAPAPASVDSYGHLLSCVYAVGSELKLKVCEKIVDRDGQAVPDVSTWYWNAILGKSEGPWTALSYATNVL